MNSPKVHRRWTKATVPALALFALAGTAQADESLCGISFSTDQFGFKANPEADRSPDNCGRFLSGTAGSTASLVVYRAPADVALKKIPSTFAITNAGTIRFNMPRRVSDPRTLYYVQPIRTTSNRVLPAPGGTVYVVEYLRRVHRLQKVSETIEEEVTVVETCVHGLRTWPKAIALMSGCERRGSRSAAVISKSVLEVLESAELTQ